MSIAGKLASRLISTALMQTNAAIRRVGLEHVGCSCSGPRTRRVQYAAFQQLALTTLYPTRATAEYFGTSATGKHFARIATQLRPPARTEDMAAAFKRRAQQATRGVTS